MRRALLFVYEASQFTEIARVAELLRRSRTWEVELVFTREYPVADRDRERARTQLGVRVFGRDLREISPAAPAARTWDDAVPSPRSSSTVRRLVQRIRTRPVLERLLSSFPFQLLAEIDEARKNRERVRRLLEDRDPHLVVFAEENAGYDEIPPPLVIARARQRGIASLVVPYTLANATEIASQCFEWPSHQVRGLPGRLAAWIAPHWTFEYRGRRLLRLPATKVLAREMTGTGVARPWTFYSGEADALAVESPRMLAYWRADGVPASRLQLTGALYDDVLARANAERESKRLSLAQALGLPPERPWVVSALPPAAPARLAPDFTSYREMLRFWIDSLLARFPDANVLLRPHPSTRSDELPPIDTSRGLRLSVEDTAALVPLADLYVASISATIRWAIAAAVPVVNYDVYRFGYHDYNDAPGVLTVDSREDFQSALSSAAPGTAGHADLAAKQRLAAPEWGTLDGRAGERMLALIDRIVNAARGTKETT